MTHGDEFEFPECWSNDVRMGALFAPFRCKSVNPTDYDSKMKFWTILIENWCKHHKSPVFELSKVKNNFCRKGSAPACLEEVFQHMRRTEVLIPKEDFLISDKTWKGWAIKVLVAKPMQWTFNTFKSTIMRQENQREILYIHLPVIKDLGEKLLKSIPPFQYGKVVSIEDLCKWGVENPEVLDLVIHWLQRQGKVAVCQVGEHALVKLPRKGMGPVKISEADMGIYSLEKQEKILENDIKNLENERNETLKEAKAHLASKMTNLAKISLRKKMEIEKRMEKRVIVLGNIQGILGKIHQAKLDSEVVDCYQKGIATLKQIYRESGLSKKSVTGTMNELMEVLDGRNEIEEALAGPLDQSLEDELEDELNSLLLKNAPKVPSDPLPDLPLKAKDGEAIETRMQALSI